MPTTFVNLARNCQRFILEHPPAFGWPFIALVCARLGQLEMAKTRFTSIAISLGVIVCAAPAAVSDDETQEQLLREVAVGYRNHREAFPLLDCTFTWKKYANATFADLPDLAGPEPVVSMTGRYMVALPLLKYELMCDRDEKAALEEALRAKTKGVPLPSGDVIMTPVPCKSTRVIQNGAYTLRHAPLIEGANIFTPEDTLPLGGDPSGIIVLPYTAMLFGPGSVTDPLVILAELTGDSPREHSIRLERGDEGELIVVTSEHNAKWYFHKFDRERGYMLVEASVQRGQSKEVTAKMEVLEAREFEDGRWFPLRVVREQANVDPSNVYVLQVTDITVDEPIGESEFYLDLPKGTQVSSMFRTEWIGLDGDERFTPDDLAALNARCVANGAAYADRRRAELEGAGKAQLADNGGVSLTSILVWVNVGAIAVLVIVMSVLRIRKA